MPGMRYQLSLREFIITSFSMCCLLGLTVQTYRLHEMRAELRRAEYWETEIPPALDKTLQMQEESKCKKVGNFIWSINGKDYVFVIENGSMTLTKEQ